MSNSNTMSNPDAKKEPIKLAPVSRELSLECLERIRIARIALLTEAPFFGIIGSQLKLIEDNIRCSTMATDGKNFFYNVRFTMGVTDPVERAEYEKQIRERFTEATDEQIKDALDGLTDDELRAAIVHEILHCMMNHFIRRNGRDPKKWNRAADYAINQIIEREHIGKLSKNWLFDKKYDKMSAEQIYDLLKDQSGEGESWDEHYTDGSGGGSGKTDKDGNDRGTVGSVFEGMDDTGMEDNMESFDQTVRNAAFSSGVPESLADLFADMTKSVIDWKSKLRRTIQALIKQDQSFQRPNRRSWNMGVIFPGFLPEETIDICIAIDLSGSISNAMVKDFLGEVYGITQQFPQFKIKLMCFDTAVHNVQDFTENNVDDLLKYKLVGGGGTIFTCVWDHMKEKEYVPEQIIWFTDGECWGDGENGGWGPSDYCETLWVLHSNPKLKAPFGETTHYEYTHEEA